MLNVTQPVWERGLDLRDLGKLMVASASSLEILSGDRRMLGTEQGHLGLRWARNMWCCELSLAPRQ